MADSSASGLSAAASATLTVTTSHEFEHKYREHGSGKTDICKKMIRRMCNALKITLMEMRVMYDYFATAEEDDLWKSWGTSDEYLEVLTLRYTTNEECELFDSSDESEGSMRTMAMREMF